MKLFDLLSSKTEYGLLGVSVHYLGTQFLQEVEDAGMTREAQIYDLEDTRSATPGLIRRKGVDVLCPVTKKMGAAYVHCLSDKDDVGPATHILSYSWGYQIGNIVDTLEAYCKGKEINPKRTYFWICCLCNNQHRVYEELASDSTVSTQEFLDIFKAKVLKIGNMVSMLDLWDNPYYFKRAWCVFEIYTAVEHNSEVNVDIELPPREKERMINDVFDAETEYSGSLTQLYRTMAETKVENAQASVKEDLDRILKILREGVGYEKTNDQVDEIYRCWIKRTVDDHVELIRTKWKRGEIGPEEFAVFCVRAGVFYNKYSEYNHVLELSNEALEHFQGSEDNRTCANLHNNVGIALFWEGKLNRAMDKFRKALRICESVLGDHPDTANAHNGVALIYLSKMKTESAMNELEKSLAMQETAFGKDHPNTAWTHYLIATAIMQLPKLDEALLRFEKAIELQESHCGKSHPTTALFYTNTSVCLGMMGRLEESEHLMMESKRIRQATLGSAHRDTLMTRAALPMVACSKHAWKMFEGVTGAMMESVPEKMFGSDSKATRFMAQAREQVGTAEGLSKNTQKVFLKARKFMGGKG